MFLKMDKNSLKISVLMSVCGYRGYVEKTIESILDQTYRDFEFVIVDDGCKYELEEIIGKYNDKRIVFVKNNKNIGLTKSLVKGMNCCSGKYIARMDAGNLAGRKRLEMQCSFLESYPDYYLAGSFIRLIDEHNKEICIKKISHDFNHLKSSLASYNCMYHSSIMFRNSGIKYRKKFIYSQDYDFYLNILSSGKKITNIQEVLIDEIYLDSSITFSKRQLQEMFAGIARKYYFERIKTGNDSYNELDSMKEILDYQYLDTGKNGNDENEGRIFYLKQKAYYCLFGGKKSMLLKTLKEIFKYKIDFKMLVYIIASYTPFAVNLIRKIKKIDIY